MCAALPNLAAVGAVAARAMMLVVEVVVNVNVAAEVATEAQVRWTPRPI